MNAMSVSPVKPPLNAGTHAVPATATNLTKPALPPANSFNPLNLIPEVKPLASPTISSSPEKSIDLCSKLPPTSNGTVFPIPETNSNACFANSQNCVEDCETAENLSTNKTQKTIEPTPVEPKVTSEVVEDKKLDLKKANIQVDDNLDSEKEIPAQVDPVKETSHVADNVPLKEDKKELPVVANTTETIPNNVTASPAKKEPSPEAAKVETSPVPEKKKTPEDSVKESDESKETKEAQSEEAPKPTTPKTVKRKAKPPAEEPVEDDSADGRKSKRVRLPTQPYQSPIPELQLIAKLNTPVRSTPKNSNEKIIAFYKNEFLAVRNPEGSFYICQTFQNIHKNSTKIKIRWFTHLPQDIFTPDFYDTTEFDCILTNVTMTRVEKDRWKLPDHERTRIENILKRALDFEKGVDWQPSFTEEHPDGLDLSLFKDEAQLKKKKKKTSPKNKAAVASAAAAAKSPEKKKQKANVSPKTDKVAAVTPSPVGTKKSSRLSSANQTATTAVAKEKELAEKTKNVVETKAKKDKKYKKNKKGKNSKKSSTSSPKPTDKNTSKTWEPSVKASNSSRVVLSLKKEDVTKSSPITETKTTTKRTSNVSLKASSTAVQSLTPQKRRKEEPKPAVTASNPSPAAERTGKVRNAGSAVTAKINSAAMRTTKDKERKTSASSNQRKK